MKMGMKAINSSCLSFSLFDQIPTVDLIRIFFITNENTHHMRYVSVKYLFISNRSMTHKGSVVKINYEK